MKLYCVSVDDYEKYEKTLQKLRLEANMVCLYGDCSRACMKHEHLRKANVFAADNGEFVFSGCYSLCDVRSAFLPDTVRILREHGVRYAFRLEDPSACGGTVDLSVSDPSLKNDRYTYMVQFDSDTQKDAVLAACAGYCTFHFLDDDTAYLIFNDSDPRKTVPSVHKALRIAEEDVIFLTD